MVYGGGQKLCADQNAVLLLVKDFKDCILLNLFFHFKVEKIQLADLSH